MAVQRSSMFEEGMAATIEVDGPEDSYSTRIEDIRGDYLLIATPMKQRQYIDLDPGKRVLLQVTRRNSPSAFVLQF